MPDKRVFTTALVTAVLIAAGAFTFAAILRF
jgi:hypothetical protein